MTTLPLSTYLLWLICISGAFSLSTSPLPAWAALVTPFALSRACEIAQKCLIHMQAPIRDGRVFFLIFLVDSARVLRQTNYCRVLKKGPESVFVATQMGYNRLQPNQTKHESSQEPPSRQTLRDGLVRMGASPLLWMLWDMLTNIFVRYVFCLLSLCTLTLARHGNQNRSLSEKRQNFCVVQFFAMLRSSALRTQFVPDHLGCNQNLVAQLWSQILLSEKCGQAAKFCILSSFAGWKYISFTSAADFSHGVFTTSMSVTGQLLFSIFSNLGRRKKKKPNLGTYNKWALLKFHWHCEFRHVRLGFLTQFRQMPLVTL